MGGLWRLIWLRGWHQAEIISGSYLPLPCTLDFGENRSREVKPLAQSDTAQTASATH